MILKSLSHFSKLIMDSRLSRYMIPPFSAYYRIAVEEAEKQMDQYGSLNEFFTRRLKPGARAIDHDRTAIISPVDGAVSEYGSIQQGTLIQAKGVNYHLSDLLGQDTQRAKRFEEGHFITIYLSPQNYHRIHCPADAHVEGYTYIPGSFFPVNKLGVNYIPGLFAKNERMISYLQSEFGHIALVKVGAFLVGSVQIVYDQLEDEKRKKKLIYTYPGEKPFLKKGAEIGFFQFGSTVICLFEKDTMQFSPHLQDNRIVQLGQRIGEFI